MVRRALPSVFTVGNLFLGIISIIVAFQGNFDWAALLVIIGMLLDGLDGRVARMLNAQSEFGKELDSLSDVISFGVAPAFIMYGVVLNKLGWIGMVITAIFPICGALRLARFNVATGSPNYFVGLPITAAGGVLATLALYHDLLPSPNITLPLLMVFLAYLMVSNVKYPNFKKVGIPKATYYIVPVILLIVLGTFFFWPQYVNRLIFLPLACYALYGVLKKNGKKKRRKKKAVDDSFNSFVK
ncbi:CDP-diacylglycerol--serine O-phosphatidyltransferase [Tumebacillus lipolyticus]|uniref:CDP-diacylglycerol--serine O-phosphatidyltransferase n=1 Tax=Tumebacillus lipolyticus TaxID=1280370 RepID=A0ABW5A2A0_9BACL